MDRAWCSRARCLRRIHSYRHPHRPRRQGAHQSRPARACCDLYTGERAPCPCIADGVMLATNASPGQGTLVIAPEKAPAGMLAVVVVRNRKTGEGFRYTVADTWLPKVIEWNKTLDPAGRFDAAMKAEGLFEFASAPAPK